MGAELFPHWPVIALAFICGTILGWILVGAISYASGRREVIEELYRAMWIGQSLGQIQRQLAEELGGRARAKIEREELDRAENLRN